MDAQQGSLELLETEIAQKLLNSSIPARLAYVALDGSPVAIPIWFHWNGSEIVFASPVDALKVPAMKARPRAAVTIDTDTMPYEALMIRETVAFERINGVVEEYALTARRCLGDEAAAPWLKQLASVNPPTERISLTPIWVGLIDFQTRFPQEVVRIMQQVEATS